jgi:hypothetical protein
MNEEVESGNKRVCIFILFLLVLVLGERGVWGRLRRRRRRRRVGPVLGNRKGGVGGLWWVVVVCVYL